MSRWTHCSLGKVWRARHVTGVYVIYSGDRILYIGSAMNVEQRMKTHLAPWLYGPPIKDGIWRRLEEGDVVSEHTLRFKFRAERKFGERLMAEERLTAKLRPPLNNKIRRWWGEWGA